MREERGGNTSDGGLEMVRNIGRSRRVLCGFPVVFRSSEGEEKECASVMSYRRRPGGEGEKRRGRRREGKDYEGDTWWSRRSAETGDRGERSDRCATAGGVLLLLAAK
ncbi:hypothetical protein HAX54_012754 [Datura stramonium]|uniref:Uncharacterized protein n=1 Tax=Datura stramonium TaxID=4076 RepID=A0ABS8RXT9_DATST|nr:hypothetical protein [Datura stramonium]